MLFLYINTYGLGIAMTQPGLDVMHLLERADKGCYISKDAGKNAYSFEMQKAVLLKKITSEEDKTDVV